MGKRGGHSAEGERRSRLAKNARRFGGNRGAAHAFLLNLVAAVGGDLRFWNELAKSEAREALAFLGCSDRYEILIGLDDGSEAIFDLAMALAFDGVEIGDDDIEAAFDAAVLSASWH